MMMSSGWGTGSGSVLPSRRRRSSSAVHFCLYSNAFSIADMRSVVLQSSTVRTSSAKARCDRRLPFIADIANARIAAWIAGNSMVLSPSRIVTGRWASFRIMLSVGCCAGSHCLGRFFAPRGRPLGLPERPFSNRCSTGGLAYPTSNLPDMSLMPRPTSPMRLASRRRMCSTWRRDLPPTRRWGW